MLITLVRAAILYVLIIIAVRVMGKRQIGELQPSELVITILISEIVAIPMQENGLPLINSIIPVFLLVAFEIIVSVLNMKSEKFRKILSGNPLIIIRDGRLDQKQMKRVRFTVDDLMESLRQKNIFDISEVQYAIVETNGTLTVLSKPQKRVVTAEMMNAAVQDNGIPCVIINDGRVIEKSFEECEMNYEILNKTLKDNSLEAKSVLIMTADKSKNFVIIKKDESN